MGNFGRRKQDRYDLRVDARLKIYDTSGLLIDKHESLCTIRNICAGGAYIDTDRPLQVGTKVDVNFQLSFQNGSDTGKQSSVAVSGHVVRNEPVGMAVQFSKNYQISAIGK